MPKSKLQLWKGTQARDSHLVGFFQILGPRAFGRWELATAIGAEAAVAVFGPVKFGQKLTSFSVKEAGRMLVLENSGRLKKDQAAIALEDDLEGAVENVRPFPGDRGQSLSLASLLWRLAFLLGSLRW